MLKKKDTNGESICFRDSLHENKLKMLHTHELFMFRICPLESKSLAHSITEFLARWTYNWNVLFPFQSNSG